MGETKRPRGAASVSNSRILRNSSGRVVFWGYVAAAAFRLGQLLPPFSGGAALRRQRDLRTLGLLGRGRASAPPRSATRSATSSRGGIRPRYGINAMVLAGTDAWGTAGGLTVAVLLSAIGLSNAVVFFAFCTFRRSRKRPRHSQCPRRGECSRSGAAAPPRGNGLRASEKRGDDRGRRASSLGDSQASS